VTRLRSLSGGIVSALFAAVLVAGSLQPAWAQLRMIPTTGKRAMLTGYENPFVVLGTEKRRLAPGALIFDTHNRTILPGYLPAAADVVYTTDHTGSVMRIYLLTPHEQKRLDEARR
jgi:hypothetical protein